MKSGPYDDKYGPHGGYERKDEYISRHTIRNKMREAYWNDLTKDLFGWTIEDKIRSMKPEERYMPVLGEIG